MAMLAVFIYAQLVRCLVLNVLGCMCPGPSLFVNAVYYSYSSYSTSLFCDNHQIIITICFSVEIDDWSVHLDEDFIMNRNSDS